MGGRTKHENYNLGITLLSVVISLHICKGILLVLKNISPCVEGGGDYVEETERKGLEAR